MSTRPSLRSTSSGRPPGNTPNSRAASGTAAPPPAAHPRQNSIRAYFSSLSPNTSVTSQTPSSKVDAAGSLGARKARSHHDLARPSIGTTDRDPLKPPPNSSVAQPTAPQLLPTNGVRAPLHLIHDEPTSEASTPRPYNLDDATPKPVGSSARETRTLRSKDGGSRLKSGLSIYFANYDDIITDAPKPPGSYSLTLIHWSHCANSNRNLDTQRTHLHIRRDGKGPSSLCSRRVTPHLRTLQTQTSSLCIALRTTSCTTKQSE
jgi:hypothetical protein